MFLPKKLFMTFFWLLYQPTQFASYAKRNLIQKLYVAEYALSTVKHWKYTFAAEILRWAVFFYFYTAHGCHATSLPMIKLKLMNWRIHIKLKYLFEAKNMGGDRQINILCTTKCFTIFM